MLTASGTMGFLVRVGGLQKYLTAAATNRTDFAAPNQTAAIFHQGKTIMDITTITITIKEDMVADTQIETKTLMNHRQDQEGIIMIGHRLLQVDATYLKERMVCLKEAPISERGISQMEL